MQELILRISNLSISLPTKTFEKHKGLPFFVFFMFSATVEQPYNLSINKVVYIVGPTT